MSRSVPPSTSVERLAYSPAEIAEGLGICVASVYNLINRGELRAQKIGRSTRIARSELERLAGMTGGDDVR